MSYPLIIVLLGLLSLLELLISLKSLWVDQFLVSLDQLQVIIRLVLVYVHIEVGFLYEARPRLGALQIVHECVLRISHLDALLQNLRLMLEGDRVNHG